MDQSWVADYYEALDFFFWEPQHLGRRRYAESAFQKHTEVQAHLREMEVTLNHLLKQFFSLAPTSFRNRFAEAALCRPVTGRFSMAGSDYDKEFHLGGTIQPDLLFTTADQTISVEMKLKAKSSVTQVLKYLLLSLATETHVKSKKDHQLIFIGPTKFVDLWKEKFRDADSLRLALAEKLDGFASKYQRRLTQTLPRFLEISRSIEIAFLTYEELDRLLEFEQRGLDESELAEVYAKLLEGLRTELTRRGLTSPLK